MNLTITERAENPTKSRQDFLKYTMKRYFLLVFAIFVALVIYAQCDVAAYIVDPDGYVNVRSDANSKADIVTKLNSGTTVYYEYNSNSKWYRISLEKAGTPLGYIHSSRLELVTSSDPVDNYDDASAFNIVVKEPGNILKYLPMDQLTQIKSLTISGNMYETDIAIIKMCTNLQYLNMATATISESPESFERRKNDMFKSHDPMPDCYIPAEAFAEMKLTEVVLPKTVKLICTSAFYGCTSLEKVNLGESLLIIERSAFAKTSISEIKFPKSLKQIKGEAFDKVTTLRVIDLSKCIMPEFARNIRGIEVNANIGCLPSLETLYMPQGMDTFNPFVSKDCSSSNLKDVYVGKDVKIMNYSLDNVNLHFQSEIAPDLNSFGFSEKITNCTIYVPKNGNITSYFAKFNGNGNKIVQE